MEGSIAAAQERAHHSERLHAASDALAGMAVERQHRAVLAAVKAGPVLTESAAAQLAQSRRDIPDEAAYNGMGI